MSREWKRREEGTSDLSLSQPRPSLKNSLPPLLSLAAGATARLTYTLTPKQPLSGLLDPASITYATSDAPKAKKNAVSTRAGIHAQSPLQAALRQAMKVGSVLSLGILRTPEQYRALAVTSGVGGAVLGAWALWKGAGSAVASRKRARALKEVEKMR